MTCRSSLRSLRTSRQHAESTIHQIKCLVIIIVLNLANLVTDMLLQLRNGPVSGFFQSGSSSGQLTCCTQWQYLEDCTQHPFSNHRYARHQRCHAIYVQLGLSVLPLRVLAGRILFSARCLAGPECPSLRQAREPMYLAPSPGPNTGELWESMGTA